MRSNLNSVRRRVAVVGATALVMASVGLGTPAAAQEEGDDAVDSAQVEEPADAAAPTDAEDGQDTEPPAGADQPETPVPNEPPAEGGETPPNPDPGDEGGSDDEDGTDDEDTEEIPDGPFEVDDAQLRWGINNESNNSAFFGGTFNHLSAGKIQNPGAGGVYLENSDDAGGARWINGRAAGWSAERGDVRIEKHTGGGNYRLANYGDRRTTSDGSSIGGPAVRSFSEHQAVFSGGEGEVDPEAGTAEIAWNGDLTVLYYSGMSFFYLSDPVLTVDESGHGRVHATGSGYASSMEDMTIWEPVAPRKVLIADLGSVDVSADLGFEATPRYARVENGRAAQVKTGDHWGSFPRNFIDFVEDTGAGQYWYSSGGSADGFKPALPMQISYDAGSPISGTVPPPPAAGTTGPVNEFTPPPEFTPRGGSAATPQSTPAPRNTPVASAATPADVEEDDALTIASTPVRLVSSSPDGFPYSDVHWAWWAAGTLLLASSVALAGTGFVAGRATHAT